MEDHDEQDGDDELVFRERAAQGEFQLDRKTKAARQWQVPVAAAAGGESSTLLVSSKPVDAVVKGCGPLVVNHGQTGYFRTLYSPAAFQSLAQHYASLEAVDTMQPLVRNPNVPLSQLLDELEDPHNLGSIIRTVRERLPHAALGHHRDLRSWPDCLHLAQTVRSALFCGCVRVRHGGHGGFCAGANLQRGCHHLRAYQRRLLPDLLPGRRSGRLYALRAGLMSGGVPALRSVWPRGLRAAGGRVLPVCQKFFRARPESWRGPRQGLLRGPQQVQSPRPELLLWEQVAELTEE